MDNVWFPCGHNGVTTWTPHGFQVGGFHMDTMWFPGGHYMVSTWTPCGVQETSTKKALHKANFSHFLKNFLTFHSLEKVLIFPGFPVPVGALWWWHTLTPGWALCCGAAPPATITCCWPLMMTCACVTCPWTIAPAGAAFRINCAWPAQTACSTETCVDNKRKSRLSTQQVGMWWRIRFLVIYSNCLLTLLVIYSNYLLTTASKLWYPCFYLFLVLLLICCCCWYYTSSYVSTCYRSPSEGWGKVIVSVCSHLGGGVPGLRSWGGGGVTRSQVQGGYPISGRGGGGGGCTRSIGKNFWHQIWPDTCVAGPGRGDYDV